MKFAVGPSENCKNAFVMMMLTSMGGLLGTPNGVVSQIICAQKLLLKLFIKSLVLDYNILRVAQEDVQLRRSPKLIKASVYYPSGFEQVLR